MRYAQIKGGRKLHLVCEPGEAFRGQIVRKGYIGNPICGTPVPPEGFRMTINVPLGHACQSCQRVFRAGKWQ